MPGVFKNVDRWLEENKNSFAPPVCLKMMHDDQLLVFYVGGPNQRKDFHLDLGEEFFYMVKGDMCLKVLEKGQHRDVIIKEGEVFLLPSNIPHSPQRQADTVGLVIERLRQPGKEVDGLKYFTEEDGVPTTDVLYEDWFQCTRLEDLGSVIKKFFQSEQHKTGKPIPGSLLPEEDKPVKIDPERSLGDPFSLSDWLADHAGELDSGVKVDLFPGKHQFSIQVCGKGEHEDQYEDGQTYIWQLRDCSSVTIDEEVTDMKENDSVLISPSSKVSLSIPEGARAIVVKQPTPEG